MISPRLAIVKDDFLNGSLKFIAGRGFKAPSITERNLYSGIVDAATGSSPYPWKVQGIAMGNDIGFTRYDFYDVGNGQWDYYEPFVGGGAVFVDVAQTYEIQNAYLYDINDELILAYKVIQKDVHKLLEFLAKYDKFY